MARIIAASIDLNKIDKTRIKKGDNGALYYDVSIVLNDQFNSYGQDVALKEGRTKEEREAKKKDVYIGNGKTVWKNESAAQTDAAPDHNKATGNTNAPTMASGNGVDDLPF